MSDSCPLGIAFGETVALSPKGESVIDSKIAYFNNGDYVTIWTEKTNRGPRLEFQLFQYNNTKVGCTDSNNSCPGEYVAEPQMDIGNTDVGTYEDYTFLIAWSVSPLSDEDWYIKTKAYRYNAVNTTYTELDDYILPIKTSALNNGKFGFATFSLEKGFALSYMHNPYTIHIPIFKKQNDYIASIKTIVEKVESSYQMEFIIKAVPTQYFFSVIWSSLMKDRGIIIQNYRIDNGNKVHSNRLKIDANPREIFADLSYGGTGVVAWKQKLSDQLGCLFNFKIQFQNITTHISNEIPFCNDLGVAYNLSISSITLDIEYGAIGIVANNDISNYSGTIQCNVTLPYKSLSGRVTSTLRTLLNSPDNPALVPCSSRAIRLAPLVGIPRATNPTNTLVATAREIIAFTRENSNIEFKVIPSVEQKYITLLEKLIDKFVALKSDLYTRQTNFYEYRIIYAYMSKRNVDPTVTISTMSILSFNEFTERRRPLRDFFEQKFEKRYTYVMYDVAFNPPVFIEGINYNLVGTNSNSPKVHLSLGYKTYDFTQTTSGAQLLDHFGYFALHMIILYTGIELTTNGVRSEERYAPSIEYCLTSNNLRYECFGFAMMHYLALTEETSRIAVSNHYLVDIENKYHEKLTTAINRAKEVLCKIKSIINLIDNSNEGLSSSCQSQVNSINKVSYNEWYDSYFKNGLQKIPQAQIHLMLNNAYTKLVEGHIYFSNFNIGPCSINNVNGEAELGGTHINLCRRLFPRDATALTITESTSKSTSTLPGVIVHELMHLVGASDNGDISDPNIPVQIYGNYDCNKWKATIRPDIVEYGPYRIVADCLTLFIIDLFEHF